MYDIYRILNMKDEVLFMYSSKKDAIRRARDLYEATGEKTYIIDTKGNEVYECGVVYDQK
jgi:hypothetical protein